MRRLMILFCLLAGLRAPAQSNAAERAYRGSGLQNQAVFTGPEYLRFPGRIPAGHPYLETDSFRTGTVLYDHRRYDSLQVLLDIHSDQLIVISPSNNYHIALQRAKVNEVSVGGHRFIGFADSTVSRPGSGLWEILYDGPTQVYRKPFKELEKHVEPDYAGGITYIVRPSERYAIRYKGVFYRADDRRALARAFGERNATIQKFERQAGLRFRRDMAADLVRVARFVDSNPQ